LGRYFQGYKPEPKKFVPRVKQKGKSKPSNIERRKAIVRGAEERERLAETKRQKIEDNKSTKPKKKVVKEKIKLKNNERTKADEPILEKKSVLNRFLKS